MVRQPRGYRLRDVTAGKGSADQCSSIRFVIYHFAYYQRSVMGMTAFIRHFKIYSFSDFRYCTILGLEIQTGA